MQPDEHARAFRAFRAYLSLGPARSLTRARAALSAEGAAISLRQLKRWSAAHDWVSRVRAFDADEAARTFAARTDARVNDEIEAYRTRRLREAIEQHEGLTALSEIANARLASMRPDELRPQDAARFLEVAAKLSASAAGMESQAIGLAELLTVLQELQEHDERHGTPGSPSSGSTSLSRFFGTSRAEA